MKSSKLFLILALLMVGLFMCSTSSQAQSKGKEAQKKIEKSKVGKDMRDVKKNAPATFDGSKKRSATPSVKVKTSTSTPKVTPKPRGQYVPKKYKSLHTTPPPSPKTTPKTSSSKSSKSPQSSSSSSSSKTKKK